MRNMATGLTANDLLKRRDKIAASDVPGIMGTSRFFNAADVFLWKTASLAPLEPSEAMKWGHRIEIPLLEYTEETLREFLHEPGLKITRRGTRCVHSNLIMSCTLDAKIKGRNEAIEAKTHAVIHGGVDLSEWGDPWTDSVPASVLDQVLAQQGCCPELIRTWVVLWAGRSVPTIYCVERTNHLERIAFIEETCCDFNDNHLVPNIPPAMAPHMDTLKRDTRVRQSAMAVALADGPLEQSKSLASQITALTNRKKEIDAGIRNDMAGTTLGRSPRGHVVELSSYNRKGYTVDPSLITRMDISLKTF